MKTSGKVVFLVLAGLFILGAIWNMNQQSAPMPSDVVDATVTPAEMADAVRRVKTAIDNGIIIRYDCAKRFAYVNGSAFAALDADAKAGFGPTLMTACGVAPKFGTHTLLDQQSGKPLMHFSLGRIEAQ
jgi:hypothetical protein